MLRSRLFPILLALASFAGAQPAPPSYSDLKSLPRQVFPSQSFSNSPDDSGVTKGFECSSIFSVQGRIFVCDDESKPIRNLSDGKEDPKGLFLLELRPDLNARRSRPTRAWPEAFQAAIAGGAKFDDIESSTARGNTVFFMGSHSFNKSGERKPQREVLLRLQLGAKGEAKVDFRPSGLREALVPLIGGLPGVTLSPEEISAAINIEGLSIDPESSDLLFGLKTPLIGPEMQALVVRLKDPTAFLDGTEQALSISKEALLPTRSGISSLEWDSVNRVFIVATSYKEWEAAGSNLWLWKGGSAAPREVCNFRNLALEGVYRADAGPMEGNLLLAFDQEMADPNGITKDHGSVSMVSWGRK